MAKMTFNKNNWSGEDITINVNMKEKAFNLYDYRFTLGNHKSTDKDGQKWERYEVTCPSWNHPVCVVERYDWGRGEGWESWEAYDQDMHPYHGGISRSAIDKFQAVTQFLCNVI